MTISIKDWTPESYDRAQKEHRELCAEVVKTYAAASYNDIAKAKYRIDELYAAITRYRQKRIDP